MKLGTQAKTGKRNMAMPKISDSNIITGNYEVMHFSFFAGFVVLEKADFSRFWYTSETDFQYLKRSLS